MTSIHTVGLRLCVGVGYAYHIIKGGQWTWPRLIRRLLRRRMHVPFAKVLSFGRCVERELGYRSRLDKLHTSDSIRDLFKLLYPKPREVVCYLLVRIWKSRQDNDSYINYWKWPKAQFITLHHVQVVNLCGGILR